MALDSSMEIEDHPWRSDVGEPLGGASSYLNKFKYFFLQESGDKYPVTGWNLPGDGDEPAGRDASGESDGIKNGGSRGLTPDGNPQENKKDLPGIP